MRKRHCPVCEKQNAKEIMVFTPELLLEMNPTYSVEMLNDALDGKENMLSYSQCQVCKMIYCENYFDDEILEKIYTKIIDHNKSKQKIISVKKRIGLHRIWINILRLQRINGEENLKHLKVIDYGCGWGDFMDTVSGFGVDVLGYDSDSIKVELPKSRGQNIAKDIDSLIDFGPVDVFVMNSVLEHLQNIEEIMTLIAKVLKKDGILVFQVMDYRSSFIQKNETLLKRKIPALTKNLNPVEHVNIFDYRSVMRTLKKYNYQLIATGAVLYITDTLFIKNYKFLIRFFNVLELLSSYIIKRKGLGITVYAMKK